MVMDCLVKLETKVESIEGKIDAITATLNKTITKTAVDIAVLKAKVAIIGFIAGSVSGGLVVLVVRWIS
jgi:hypothetical protein